MCYVLQLSSKFRTPSSPLNFLFSLPCNLRLRGRWHLTFDIGHLTSSVCISSRNGLSLRRNRFGVNNPKMDFYSESESWNGRNRRFPANNEVGGGQTMKYEMVSKPIWPKTGSKIFDLCFFVFPSTCLYPWGVLIYVYDEASKRRSYRNKYIENRNL